MYKRIIIFCLFIYLSSNSLAQHKITLGAGKNSNGFKTEDLNKFMNSFNGFHQSIGFVPFENFKSNVQSIAGNIGYRYLEAGSLSFGLQYEFGKGKNDYHTTLPKKSGYSLTHNMNHHDVWFDLGYHIGSVNISGILGLNRQINAMEIYKIYANGNRSMGYEDDLPGYYETKSFNADVGVGLGIKLWHFYVPVRFTYGIPMYKGGTVLTDYDTYRLRSNELPQDYPKWIAEQNAYDSENSISQNVFAGMRLHFGLEFMIPLGK